MAGCCPTAPAVSPSRARATEASGPESDIRRKENVDCYMSRGGNTSGRHDDATDNVPNLIENSSIPITQGPGGPRFDNIQFRLTEGSDASPGNITWSWQNNGGEPLTSLGVSLSINGVLNGPISGNAYGKTFKVTVTATTSSGAIDERSYVFSPIPATKGDEIRLISPLPGAIVNSKFGPRLHPIQQVMKPHTGIDMKYADRSVKDVVAAADGEVILAGGDAARGYGIRVWIRHRAADGTHLCDTTYNHLARVYVKVGQKVMAGQAIGLEGSTGASTGPHLHFECKLPAGTFIDPEPLINGEIQVARRTERNGDGSVLESKNSNASLSKSEAAARGSGCETFGPTYPPNPDASPDPLPPAAPSNDPFELAWFFTMTEEVGPFWDETYPQDPEVQQGLIDSAQRRRKVGYVSSPGFPGGETKFGVAQNPNPDIDVTNITYEEAKELGYRAYWKNRVIRCDNKPPLLAVMLFDMNYLHGVGNARRIWSDAFGSASATPPGSTRDEQIASCERLNTARVAFIRSIPRPEFTRGWLNRASKTLSYVKSLSIS